MQPTTRHADSTHRRRCWLAIAVALCLYLVAPPSASGQASTGELGVVLDIDAGALSVRTVPIDCTALTDGVAGELCLQLIDDRLFSCQPTAGGCDTPAEWIATTIDAVSVTSGVLADARVDGSLEEDEISHDNLTTPRTATDLGTGALDALVEIDGTLCGTDEILEDQGAAWACVATPPGDVTGPSSVIARNAVTFDGTTGKAIREPTTVPTAGDRLTWSGTEADWDAVALLSLEAQGTPEILPTEFFIGTGVGTGAWSPISGDINIDMAGVCTASTVISRDSESPAAADISGSLAAGYTIDPGAVGASELDAAAVEASLEAVLDHDDLQGLSGSNHHTKTIDASELTTGTLADARIPASVSRDSEAVAAGDVSGSLSAGYTIDADAVQAAELDELAVESSLEAVLDLADLEENQHSSLTGIGANDHHAPPAAPAIQIEEMITADVVVNNTAAETTIWSRSITLNDTDGAVRVQLGGDFENLTGGMKTLVWRIKLGATTIYDSGVSPTLKSEPIPRGWTLDFLLQNRASVSAQQLTGNVRIDLADVNPTVGYGVWGSTTVLRSYAAFGGSAAETWSSALTVAVTVQLSAASAATTLTLRGGMIERITP